MTGMYSQNRPNPPINGQFRRKEQQALGYSATDLIIIKPKKKKKKEEEENERNSSETLRDTSRQSESRHFETNQSQQIFSRNGDLRYNRDDR